MTLKGIIERQNRILEIVVSSYVDTAMPVGSRLVSKALGLSSATIRNIMSDLEEMGYITHPHTSAGRIPTDKGYRRYVESLMHVKEINSKEARKIEEEYKSQRRNIEDVIKKSADILAGITQHTGVVLFPKFKKPAFKRIELVSVGKKRVLVVLVTATGIVKNFIMDTRYDLGEEMALIGNLLNSDFYGLTLEEIKNKLIGQLKKARDSSYHIIKETSEIIESMLGVSTEDELYLGGTSFLLAQPEFEDTNSAKLLLQVFENKYVLSRLMEEDISFEGIKVYIGKENKCRGIQNCSLVTSGYKVKDEVVGRLGIIGPTRMEYSHLIPLVHYIAETMTRTLNELVE